MIPVRRLGISRTVYGHGYSSPWVVISPQRTEASDGGKGTASDRSWNLMLLRAFFQTVHKVGACSFSSSAWVERTHNWTYMVLRPGAGVLWGHAHSSSGCVLLWEFENTFSFFISVCQLECRLSLTVVSKGLSSGSGEKPESNLVLFDHVQKTKLRRQRL